MATICTGLPSSSMVRAAILVRRSVVRIASAAGSGSVASEDASAGIAARMRSTGSGEPMAPVDAVRTSSGVSFSAAAAAAATARSSTAPRGPTMALALPLLATMARIPIAGRRPAAYSTGAARMRLTVNTPAAAHGTSETTAARSRRPGAPDSRMPAAVAPNRNPCGQMTLVPGSPLLAATLYISLIFK